MNTISTTQQIEIEVLSPLHIGAGGDNLLNDVDYVSTNEKIYVIDEEAMFQALSSDRLKQAERATSLSQLLHHREYDQFARYVLDNPTGSGRVSHMVRQMKTAYGAPYVPGSSLKGAIRTALFWAMLAEDRYGIEPDRLGKSPRFADDPLEKKLLAPASRKPRVDPNRDILRAFQVKDSQAISAPDALTLLQVTLYSLRGRPGSLQPKEGEDWSFFVEALAPGTRLNTSIRLDLHLLEPTIARLLGWDGKQSWVYNWLTHCNAHSREIIAHEQTFYTRHALPEVAAFYAELAEKAETMEEQPACLLHLSWGTGWLSKTVGTAMDAATKEDIRGSYRLGRRGYDIFPKSRRLIERGGTPVMPPGWVILRLIGGDGGAPLPPAPPPSKKQARPGSAARPPETPETPARSKEANQTPRHINDVQPGMVLEGVVQGIKHFGAFVDIGVGVNGLVHISELRDGWVNNVEDVVSEGQPVRVRVLDVDLNRKRIGLSMKGVA